nr:hypothetical protein [Tessaracoccus coleopterorum]
MQLIAQDPAPSINAVMFLRMALETAAIVVTSIVLFTRFDVDWTRALVTIGIMLAVSFIMWGVAPARSDGRVPREP